jgi:hypothetical protein
MAGFGTAGSMLAGGAVVFVLASAVVAFQGWPRIATQGSPAAIQISATPAPPSVVSRRLRAVGSPPAARAVAALRAGVRAAAPPAARPVGLHTPTGGAGRPTIPSSTPGRAERTARSGGGSVRASSGGSGSQNVAVSTPTNPPVTLTVPPGTVTHGVKTGVRKVSGTGGNTASSTGSQVGSAVGGPVGGR